MFKTNIMKLFIWMGEYDFCLSVANTVEEARELLKLKSDDNKNKYQLLYAEWGEAVMTKNRERMDKIFPLMHNQSLCNLTDESDIGYYDIDIRKEPDFVYEVTSPIAQLFHHGNE